METLHVSAVDILSEKTKFCNTHCTAITQLSTCSVSYHYQETMKLDNFISQEKYNTRRAKSICAASS